MTAPGRIPIDLNLLRMVLDLPKGFEIVGSVTDLAQQRMVLLVNGPGVEPGQELQPVYRHVNPGQAILDNLAGRELVEVQAVRHG